jgi:hypothetical protein
MSLKDMVTLNEAKAGGTAVYKNITTNKTYIKKYAKLLPEPDRPRRRRDRRRERNKKEMDGWKRNKEPALTLTTWVPGEWSGKTIPINMGKTVMVNIKDESGAALKLKVRKDPITQDTVFGLYHESKDWWNAKGKDLVHGGVLGDPLKVVKHNEPSTKRIKNLERALHNMIAAFDCFTSDAYYPNGTKRLSWDLNLTEEMPYSIIQDMKKGGILSKGVPLHCRCGKHKSRDGLFTCKDLHDRVEAARLLISL